jgi:hypothetical protein
MRLLFLAGLRVGSRGPRRSYSAARYLNRATASRSSIESAGDGAVRPAPGVCFFRPAFNSNGLLWLQAAWDFGCAQGVNAKRQAEMETPMSIGIPCGLGMLVSLLACDEREVAADFLESPIRSPS